jgi:hypothetical protein
MLPAARSSKLKVHTQVQAPIRNVPSSSDRLIDRHIKPQAGGNRQNFGFALFIRRPERCRRQQFIARVQSIRQGLRVF